MENSKIAWTDHTFNPWVGCDHSGSPGCDNCYAAAMVNRWNRDFGKRVRTTEANWKKPLAWNRKAQKEGTRPRVFCGSMCDYQDETVPQEWRDDLWDLILSTPHLTWLLLSKRFASPSPLSVNFHLGITAENQEWLEHRMRHVIPGAQVFVSAEPLLGPLDLTKYHKRISWIIIGCEKIGNRPGREMRDEWSRQLIDTAPRLGIPVFMKQMKSYTPDKVTSNMKEFPSWARVRQFPSWAANGKDGR